MSSHLSPAAQVRQGIPRIAGAAVERARLTVVPHARTQAARVPFVALVSLLLLLGVIGLLLFNTSMQQASFASTTLEQQAQTLAAKEQSLTMDLERLRDPQNLAERAQRLGLVPPPASVCFLHTDGSINGVCAPAVATDAFPVGTPPPAKPDVLSPDPIIERVSGTGANRPSDTGSGDAGGGRQEGRTGHQQSQQTQQTRTR